MIANLVVKGVRQSGIYAPDPDALAKFYQEVLGLQIIGQGRLNADGVRHSVVLSRCRAAGANQVLIYADPTLCYSAFEVDSLVNLRAVYQLVVDRDLPIRWALNHGTELAFYFDDPAGNLIKLFWPTGVTFPQPHGHPIDLTQSEDELRQNVADMVANLSGCE